MTTLRWFSTLGAPKLSPIILQFFSLDLSPSWTNQWPCMSFEDSWLLLKRVRFDMSSSMILVDCPTYIVKVTSFKISGCAYLPHKYLSKNFNSATGPTPSPGTGLYLFWKLISYLHLVSSSNRTPSPTIIIRCNEYRNVTCVCHW